MQTLVRLVIASYPPWWRRRYGDQTRDLTEQLLGEPGARRVRLLAGLVVGSMSAWAQFRRLGETLRPAAGAGPWVAVPRGSHLDVLGRRGLWPCSAAALEPREVLLGVLDGATGSRRLALLPTQGIMWAVVAFAARFLIPGIHYPTVLFVVYEAYASVLLLVGLVLQRTARSRLVSVAVTSRGVVVFRRGFLTGRTGRVIERLSAVDWSLERSTFRWRQVRIGDRVLWLQRGSDPLLAWMSHAAHSAEW